MKRIIALILLLTLALCFVSCSKECVVCGEDADEKLDGEHFCSDCYKGAKELNDAGVDIDELIEELKELEEAVKA